MSGGATQRFLPSLREHLDNLTPQHSVVMRRRRATNREEMPNGKNGLQDISTLLLRGGGYIGFIDLEIFAS